MSDQEAVYIPRPAVSIGRSINGQVYMRVNATPRDSSAEAMAEAAAIAVETYEALAQRYPLLDFEPAR